MLGHKELLLDRLKCSLSFNETTSTSIQVVKPAHSTSVGMGVDFLSLHWTQELCETKLGVPCMTQRYHPGPWEVRLYKSNVWDAEAVAWKVPCNPPECEEPFPFTTRFPWQAHLEACIDRAFPNSPFLAVDVRSNGEDYLVLELNGALGMPYHWATQQGHTAVLTEHLKWISDRVRAGVYNFSVQNLVKLALLGMERQVMKKIKGKIWF